MEVGYPDDTQDNGIPYGNVNTGPSESQSTPAVKKEQGTKPKARGKSADPKKIDVENGVKLTTHRRKKKTKFHVPQGIAYPGVILGHKYCVSQGPPVPARNGWAWKTTVPLGMKVGSLIILEEDLYGSFYNNTVRRGQDRVLDRDS